MKKMLAGVGTGALMLSLAACGSTTDAGNGSGVEGETKPVEEVTVGFLQRQLDAPYYSAMQSMAEDIAEEQGFELLFQNAAGDAVQQIELAQTMISQGVDVLIVNALDPETQRDQFEQIAGDVPVVFIDTGIEGVGVTSVSSDNVAVGELSGALTAARFDEGDTIDVAVLNGGPGDIVVGPQRQQGFLDGLEKGGLTVNLVAEGVADYAQDKAVPVAESILAAHPDLDLIFGLNDSMALGALTVLQDQGNTTTLVAAASDGQKEALEIIAQGCDAQYVSTGLNSPSLATERTFEIALALATGESTADDFEPQEFTKAAGIDCNNVDEYLDENSIF